MLSFKNTSVLVTLSISLTAASAELFEPLNQPVGLLETVRVALELNPKIRANDKTLEAMALRVKALKQSRLPHLSLRASTSLDHGRMNDGFQNSSYRNTYSSAGISLDWNLFDGGAQKKRIESAECSFKERQSSFNSTNTMIRNTQGQIASVVVENYVSLVEARENIVFTDKTLGMLEKLRAAAKTQGEILEADNFIANMELNLEQLRADEVKAARNYEYVVTQSAPTSVQSFSEMIDSLVIPMTVHEALQIALEKSPEIQTARYQIECSRLRLQSAKASAYSPKVDLSVGYDRMDQDLDDSTYNTRGASIGLSIRMNFDPGSSSELKAQKKEIGSAQENLDGTLADTKHHLETDYPDLRNSIRFADLHQRNFSTNQNSVLQYISDIDSNKPVSVTDALKQVDSMIKSWYSYRRETARVLNKKFQIQKTVGTLFENLGLDAQQMNRVSLQ